MTNTSKSAMTNFNWRIAAKTGAISGLVLVLISMIGMVETFNDRFIIGSGVLTMGQALLLAILGVTSYSVARRVSKGNVMQSVLGGAFSGGIGALVLSVFVWIAETVNLRDIFVNVSPSLIKILTFDHNEPGQFVIAAGILLAVGVIFGGVFGLVQAAPTLIRKIALTSIAWIAVLGLLGELIRTILTGKPILPLVSWILGTKAEKGLSLVGAIFIIVIVALVTFLSQKYGAGIRARVSARREALPERRKRILNAALLFLAFALLWQLPALLGLYLSEVANTIGLFILMGLGLNIVVGFAGLLDLGYVAFFAIGAYVMGVATSTGVGTESGQIVFSLGWTFWEALPLAVLAAVFAGVLLGIPVLKVRGDYLAIVTLGFGEIVRIFLLSDLLKPYIGGAQGIVGVAPILVAGQNLTKPQELFHVILIGCIIVWFVAYRLRDSRVGRAWKAVREDEDVAQAMGINLVATKLLAFAAGAAFSGLAGAIFASKISSMQPGSFTFLVSLNILSLVIIGGMGSLPGVVVGALALVGLPELLREFSEYRLLMFGGALVLMMLYKPEGLWPEETHKRELREEENAPIEPVATA